MSEKKRKVNASRWKCAYCLYFDEDIAGPKCIRHAPKPVVRDFEHYEEDKPQVEAHWPYVGDEDRCGEFLDIAEVEDVEAGE